MGLGATSDFVFKVVASAAPLVAAVVTPLPSTVPSDNSLVYVPTEVLQMLTSPYVVATFAIASSYVASGDVRATVAAIGAIALAVALYRDRDLARRAL
jgi:hypothetical protein